MLTQAQIEDEIERLVAKMETQTTELAQLTMESSEHEVEFKRSYALAFTRGAGAVKDREQTATLATVDVLRAYRRAESLMKSGQEALRTTRSALDALRTLSANVRAQT